MQASSPKNPPRVSPVRPSDADALRALYALSVRANPKGFIQDLNHHGDIYDRGVEFRSSGGEILGLYDDGRLIGFGCLKPEEQNKVELCKLHLDPDYHGQGHGKTLALELITVARGLGFATVTLHVTATQTAAIGLYTRLGFQEVRRQIYDLKGQVFDTVFMEFGLN